ELLLCHRMSLQGQECGDLILISAKSSIYSTKPVFITNLGSVEQGMRRNHLFCIYNVKYYRRNALIQQSGLFNEYNR
ncbi:hypothetical protein F9C28_17070, partial [Shimwellia pseudoproteus]|nr:hypothetical protein [Shimwellia pseudoproteus]